MYYDVTNLKIGNRCRVQWCVSTYLFQFINFVYKFIRVYDTIIVIISTGVVVLYEVYFGFLVVFRTVSIVTICV